uniref:Uncharacterized protein n=1 Tax=Rhizophora mucronata TaxID=61149 RepID=A0A2P2PWM9_RHIMU
MCQIKQKMNSFLYAIPEFYVFEFQNLQFPHLYGHIVSPPCIPLVFPYY